MVKKNDDNPLYTHDTLEFVTVAVQFCSYLEQCRGCDKKDFVMTILRLLPLLYLKATLLPRIESLGDFLPSDQVTEDDYNFIRSAVADIMQQDDEYEESVFDLNAQVDEVRWLSVSEGLADMYQALRNFVSAYQQRLEDCMMDALWAVEENFDLYWGQCLVNTLRRLHVIQYGKRDYAEEDSL